VKNVHKVLWTEGMFLRPHHLQQAEEYQETYAWSLRPGSFHWGFLTLKLDESLLALGKVSLAEASGILPDGTAFDFSDARDAPAPLDIRADHGMSVIVLALPTRRAGRESVIFSEAPGSLARHLAFEKDVGDANALAVGRANVQCGKLRLRLMAENELNGEWIAMGVLRVLEKDRDGCVLLDSGYIPPLLNGHASHTLAGYGRELAGLLRQRRQQLGRHLPRREDVRDMAASELMLLALMHRFSATVDHQLALPRVHPERLFAEWLPFALELTVYRPPHGFDGAIPRYDHRDLGACFDGLMATLRQGLFIVFEETAIALPLTKQMPGLQVTTLPDREMLDRFDFILAVATELRSESQLASFLAQIKIAPTCRIGDLVQLQLPGIPLVPLPQAPRQLPFQEGCSYFALESGGAIWQQLLKTGEFAIYLTGEFAPLKLSFWAVRRQSTLGSLGA